MPCVATFLAICTSSAQIQQVRSVPSPEVANLGTFGSIPVGHYTGTPDISIPLYTLSVGNLKLPITASYHISNVKPHIPPTCLGIGWSLFAGGYIARTVHGWQDEKKYGKTNGGYYFHHADIKSLDASSDRKRELEKLNEKFKDIGYDGQYEVSADEFVFNFNGYSGSFFMDADGKWRVISDQNIKVEFNEDTGFKSIDDLFNGAVQRGYVKDNNQLLFDKFTLITPDGARYEFGGGNATEYTVPYYNQVHGDVVATCWRLVKITTPENRVVNFKYAADSYMCNIHYAPQLVKYHKKGQNLKIVNEGRSGFSGFLTMPSRLRQISTDDETVNFEYFRDNKYGSMFLQNSGCLYWEAKNGENTGYRYEYGRRNEIESPRDRFTLFLDLSLKINPSENDIREAIANKITHDRLSSINVLKAKDSLLTINFDVYGIERANNRTHPSYNDRRRFLQGITFISKEKVSPNIDEKWDVGLDDPEAYTGEPIMKKNGSSSILKPQNPGSGVPVVPYTNVRYEYAYRFYYNTATDQLDDWPERSPFTFTDSWGYYKRDETGNYCDYGKGEWIMSKTMLESYYKERAASLQTTKIYVLHTIIYPTGGKTVFDYELNDYSKQFDFRTGEVRNNVGYSGGLRVKKIRNLSPTGDILYSKEYIYKDKIGGKSSGVSKGAVQYCDTIYLDKNKSDYLTFYSFDDHAACPINFNTPDVGYTTVFEDIKDGDGKFLKRTKFTYSNFDTDAYGHKHIDQLPDYKANVFGTYSFSPFTSLAFERGKLLSEEVMDENGKVLEKNTYEYVRTSGEPCTTISQENYQGQAMSYLFKTFTNRYLTAVHTKHSMLQGGTYTDSRKYLYNNYGLVSRIENLSADGDKTTTNYTYNFDKKSDYGWMLEKNIIVPVVTQKSKGNSSLWNESVYYKSASGAPYVYRQTSGWSQTGTDAPTDSRVDVLVIRADKYGNPIEEERLGIKNIFLWSYDGQKMMASIQNSSYEEVKNALGMSPEDYSTLKDEDFIYANLPSLHKKLPQALITLYMYDKYKRLNCTIGPNGGGHMYEYDMLDRLRKISRFNGHNFEPVKIFDYHYLYNNDYR